MKKLIKFILSSAYCCVSVQSSFAGAHNADERFFYIGAEAGIVEPVHNRFKDKDTNTKLSLKRSSMFSGKVGYSFYPQMSLEFSGTHQPTYKLGYKLPEVDMIPSLSGKTKVSSQVYMVNLVYDLKDYNGFTPFVIGGVGISRLHIKPTSTSFMGQEFFRLKKSTPDCFTWQAGLGVSKSLVPNFTIDLAAKLQAVHNIKVFYEKLNPATGKFDKARPIKKTIGVWELGIGFTYKFPTFR